jgi:hypothetical protein
MLKTIIFRRASSFFDILTNKPSHGFLTALFLVHLAEDNICNIQEHHIAQPLSPFLPVRAALP